MTSYDRPFSASFCRYRELYGGSTETLRLRISPLAAVQDVVLPAEAGVADTQAVQSIALRSIGVPPEQVAKAAERLEQRQAETQRLALQAAENASAQVAAKQAEDAEKLKARAASGAPAQPRAAPAPAPAPSED